MQRVRMLSIGLNKLNGRFLWITGVLITALLTITIYAQWLVSQSDSAKEALTSNNRELSHIINEIKDSLQQVEAEVYQYASHFDHDLDLLIIFNLESLKEQADKLAAHTAVMEDAKSRQYTELLMSELGKLENHIGDFLQVMQSVQSRYPGMSILTELMEPTNRRFSEAMELALHEGTMTDIHPQARGDEQVQVLMILHELRFAWSQQVSWFRVFVANRMGAFGEPEASMRRNLANRDMFAGIVRQQLAKLATYQRQGKLGLQQTESLAVMRRAAAKYERHLQQAAKVYLSNNWRSDLPLLRKDIQPNLTLIHYQLSLLEERFNEFSDQGLSNAQRIATILTAFIWLFVSSITGLLVTGYFIYERSIRRPMLQMTGAMLAEASGQEIAHIQESEVTEISQLQKAFNGMREQVRSRQTRLESIFDNAAEGIITIDDEGRIESINSAALRLFGYTEDEVLGRHLNMFIPENVREKHDALMRNHQQSSVMIRSLEVMARHKNGKTFPMSIKVSEFKVGEQRLFTAVVDDVSERYAAMQSLRFMAEHDSLTGLYNRQYIMDELARVVENRKRNAEFNYALLYIDLDNFKYINDTMGHLAGDRLLIEIAEIFSRRLRKGDVLSRLGGDEFAVLLANVETHQAEQTAEYYRDKIANYKFNHEGKSVDIGCSIGVAILNDQVTDKEDLLARADIACHMAKRGGRNRVHRYCDEDQRKIEDLYFDMGWSNRLKQALQEDQFVFAYQPIAGVEDGTIFSYEVLLRMWEPATGDMLLPGAFMTYADRFGLMVDIDCWVIEHAIQLLAQIHQQSPAIRFSINLSAKSLTEDKVIQAVQNALARHPVSPEHIIFELTEDIAISDMATAVSFIQKLKQLGCKTALDDFGVGYSSFSYLKELPVDIVKIDGSFIRNIGTDKLNYALVKSMNDICHTLGKQTVAEFVENKAAWRLVKEIGLDYLQGYHIGRPELELPTVKMADNVYKLKPV